MFHRKIISPLLDGVNCTLRKYTCSGIKVCSKTSPDLRNFCHDEVTDNTIGLRDYQKRHHRSQDRQQQPGLRTQSWTWLRHHVCDTEYTVYRPSLPQTREIAEIKWINGHSNPADAMTKSKSCPALRELIDTNHIGLEATERMECKILGRGSQSCSHLYSTSPVPSQPPNDRNKAKMNGFMPG